MAIDKHSNQNLEFLFRCIFQHGRVHRGSYMSAHVLLIFIKRVWGKVIKSEVYRAFYIFFATS